MTNSTAIGVVYTMMGVFGIFENGLTAYLIATDPRMKNPTYFYMVNLSVADVIILVPVALQAGLIILWPGLAHPVANRVGAFLIAVGWYPGCFFMVFASYSRYVQLATPHSVPVYFSRRRLTVSTCLAWIVPSVLYTWFIYYQPVVFDFLADRYTWGFRRDVPFANGLSIFNITINSIFAICINVFNLMSLKCVRQLRRQVQNLQNNRNTRREIKLFAQCAITGTIYTLAVVYYFAVSAVEDSMVWYEFLITHILWASVHILNPIIYFALNTRLRRRVMGALCPNKVMQLNTTAAPGATALQTVGKVERRPLNDFGIGQRRSIPLQETEDPNGASPVQA